MRKATVLFAILAIFLLALGFSSRIGAQRGSLTVQGLIEHDDREVDADAGRFARDGLGFKDYLRRREGMIAKLRGLPYNGPGEPRVNAIRQLERQEEKLQGKASPSRLKTVPTDSAAVPSSATEVVGAELLTPQAPITPTISTVNWSPIGPAPIPDGQTNFNNGSVDPNLPRNPVSGRVLAIAIHPTNPNIVYVGTAQGGLYRTLNGGATWTPLMDNALSLAVGAVTIDPLDPTTLFVGTGEGNFCGDCFFGVGLYIIKNAETTPQLLGPYNSATNTPGNTLARSRSITKILVVPNDDNTVFVATGSGIGGINGGAGNGPAPTPRGLFRCSNAMSGSPSCTKLSINGPGGGINTAVRDIVFDPGNPNILLAGIDDSIGGGTNGVWRSTNALAPDPNTIAFTQTLATAAFTNVMLAINKTGNTVTVYAATEEDDPSPTATAGGTVRKSTDGGVTWSGPLTSADGFCDSQCFYDMPIAVDPTNPNNVYIGGNGDYDSVQSPFKRSTDGGATFVKKSIGLHPDSHAIAIAPSNPSVIYTGNDGGIFKTTDAGDNWTSINTAGFHATQFMSIAQHPTDRNFMIGGTQDNGTPYLQANGTWKLGDYGDGGYSLIDRNATDTGASVVAYHTYYNAKAALIGFVRADGASQIDPFTGWPVFYGCYVGAATGVMPNGISCADDVLFYAPMAQGPGNPNTIYFGTDHLYRSTDKGNTMASASQIFEVNTPTPPATPFNSTVSAIGISPQDDNVRLVGISSGRVFATTLGAPVMTEVTPPTTQLAAASRRFIGRAVIDPNDKKTAYFTLVGFGVPAGQHVWKTTNLDTSPTGATTWSPAGNGIPDVPVDAFVVDPQHSNTLYAGTDIGVYRSTDGGANWVPFSNGLPRVAVFDMAIQNNNRILRIATHGRGIWEISIAAPTVCASTTNVALASNGSTATASSSYPNGGFPASSAIDGEHKGLNWGNGGGWNDATRDVWPDTLQVDFNVAQSISEIRVYTVQNDFSNPVEPTTSTPANVYGILDFDVQAFDGTQWITVGSVTGNTKALNVVTFSPMTATKIRVVVNNGRVHFSRITELEAFGCPQT
jgi:photosystem II stability/assembly factor-like uncharacterized protein